MNKIVILNTFDYWQQDHNWIAKSAYDFFKKSGATVDIVHIPFKNEPIIYFQQVLSYRSLDLSSIDIVLTFGPFAHVIEHRKKICFITQHMSGFYELWNSPYGEIDNATTALYKDKIYYLDSMCLAEAKQSLCFYDKIQSRLPGHNIKKVPLPKLPVTSASPSSSGKKKRVTSLGIFNPDHRFELMIKSLEFYHQDNIKMTIAAKLKRKDIYESLLRLGQVHIQSGTLEIIADPSEKTERELILTSDLLIDTVTEQDSLSRMAQLAFSYRRPVIGLMGCGLLEHMIASYSNLNSIDESPTAIARFLNVHFNSSEKTAQQFEKLLANYEASKGLDWAMVLA